MLDSFEDEDECHIVTGQNTVPPHMRGVDMRAHLHMRIEFTDAVLQGHLYHIRLGLTSHASWHLIHLTELCGGGDLQKFVASTGALDESRLAVVAFEVLRTVKGCHDLGVFHGESDTRRLKRSSTA